MTKKEALEAMKQGKKVTHRYFSEEEYIYMNAQGIITTEDGYFFHTEFMKNRIGRVWEEEWYIYDATKPTNLVTSGK